MDDNKYKLYSNLVKKYSKAYYKKVSDLFDLDELAQELWVCLLSADETDSYSGKNNATEYTFLVSCIRNYMTTLITQEVKRRQVFTEQYDTVADEVASEVTSTPEQVVLDKEATDILAGRISQIKHGELVLDLTVQGYSVREIAKIAKQQGLSLSKSNVNKIQHKLREEASKVFSIKSGQNE